MPYPRVCPKLKSGSVLWRYWSCETYFTIDMISHNWNPVWDLACGFDILDPVPILHMSRWLYKIVIWSHHCFDIDSKVFMRFDYWAHKPFVGWVLGERFKDAYGLLYLRVLKVSMPYKIHIFQCMAKIFCVNFQRVPIKFHTKYLTHTLKIYEVIDLRAHKCAPWPHRPDKDSTPWNHFS